MTTREPRDPTEPGGPAADGDDVAAADFATWLRSELTPVTTTPLRAAAVRQRAHAELRRAATPPAVRARRHLLRLAETSTALAAGVSYVLWTINELWRR